MSNDTDDIDAPIPAPDGCLTSLQHESAFTALATYLYDLATEHEDEPAVLAKLAAESIKARRAAQFCALKREDTVILGRLERSRRAMQTANGAQRAPLKLVSGGHDR